MEVVLPAGNCASPAKIRQLAQNVYTITCTTAPQPKPASPANQTANPAHPPCPASPASPITTLLSPTVASPASLQAVKYARTALFAHNAR